MGKSCWMASLSLQHSKDVGVRDLHKIYMLSGSGRGVDQKNSSWVDHLPGTPCFLIETLNKTINRIYIGSTHFPLFSQVSPPLPPPSIPTPPQTSFCAGVNWGFHRGGGRVQACATEAYTSAEVQISRGSYLQFFLPLVVSPNSWMWKPCLPSVRPDTSPVTLHGPSGVLEAKYRQ